MHSEELCNQLLHLVALDNTCLTPHHESFTLPQDGRDSESGWGWSEVLGGHVASLVELRWTLGPSDTPGRASLTGITFPPSTHDLITMAPIHWGEALDTMFSCVFSLSSVRICVCTWGCVSGVIADLVRVKLWKLLTCRVEQQSNTKNENPALNS